MVGRGRYMLKTIRFIKILAITSLISTVPSSLMMLYLSFIGNWEIAPYAVLLCIGPVLSIKILSKIKKSAGLTPLKYNPKKKFWVALTLITIPVMSIPIILGFGISRTMSIIGDRMFWSTFGWIIIIVAFFHVIAVFLGLLPLYFFITKRLLNQDKARGG